jgi:hypothetical protein
MKVEIAKKPTLEDMLKLNHGEYYLWNDIVYVNADTIDKVHIKFTCPFCATRYLKNGSRSKTSKSKIHLHGSSNEFHNRFEHRIPHCDDKSNNRLTFNIAVTNLTKRL